MEVAKPLCNKDHSNTIVYIETDLLSKSSEGCGKPLAVKWEEEIVACNQVAKSYGVAEGLPFNMAMKICPGLAQISLEQAQEYSKDAENVFSIIRQCAQVEIVQRTSVDQYYLDISQHSALLDLQERSMEDESPGICSCGCESRIRLAHTIACQIAEKLHNRQITCRIGVSYSKTLARLAALQPENMVLPSDVANLLHIYDLRYVPHIPLAELYRLNIRTFADLQHASIAVLKEHFGDLSCRLKRLGFGEDINAVICEDAWRALPLEIKVRAKFRVLLLRLLSTLEEDIRVPTAIKVYLRKFDPLRGVSNKETKVTAIPPRLLHGHIRVTNELVTRLLAIVMALFRRLVNLSRPLHLTLLGLAFVRLQDRFPGSVASCLLRKREHASVQVIVDISHEGWSDWSSQPVVVTRVGDVERDVSPCQKKAKLDIVITAKTKVRASKRDLASPSKLRVADLNLNAGDEASGLIMNF